MMRGRIQAEQFAVQHVREPGERVPVAEVPVVEGPFHATPRETGLDGRVLGDVIAVVIDDEGVAARRQIRQQGDEREQQADEARAIHGLIFMKFSGRRLEAKF